MTETLWLDPPAAGAPAASRDRPARAAPGAPAARRVVDALAAAAGIGLGVTIGLEVIAESAGSLSAPGGIATALGRLAGLLAAYAMVVVVLLVARVPPLERAIGQDRLVALAPQARSVAAVPAARARRADHGRLRAPGAGRRAAPVRPAAVDLPRHPRRHRRLDPAVRGRHHAPTGSRAGGWPTRPGGRCTSTPTSRCSCRSRTRSTPAPSFVGHPVARVLVDGAVGRDARASSSPRGSACRCGARCATRCRVVARDAGGPGRRLDPAARPPARPAADRRRPVLPVALPAPRPVVAGAPVLAVGRAVAATCCASRSRTSATTARARARCEPGTRVAIEGPYGTFTADTATARPAAADRRRRRHRADPRAAAGAAAGGRRHRAAARLDAARTSSCATRSPTRSRRRGGRLRRARRLPRARPPRRRRPAPSSSPTCAAARSTCAAPTPCRTGSPPSSSAPACPSRGSTSSPSRSDRLRRSPIVLAATIAGTPASWPSTRTRPRSRPRRPRPPPATPPRPSASALDRGRLGRRHRDRRRRRHAVRRRRRSASPSRAARSPSIEAVQLQGNDPRSQQISSSAEPILQQEALTTQSAAIDAVSGATLHERQLRPVAAVGARQARLQGRRRLARDAPGPVAPGNSQPGLGRAPAAGAEMWSCQPTPTPHQPDPAPARGGARSTVTKAVAAVAAIAVLAFGANAVTNGNASSTTGTARRWGPAAVRAPEARPAAWAPP